MVSECWHMTDFCDWVELQIEVLVGTLFHSFSYHICSGNLSLSHSPLGNCNLVYAIIRKRNVFHQLANLPSDSGSIQKALQRKRKSPDVISRTSSQETVSMEGSHPAVPAEPGTLKTSLVAMPGTDWCYWFNVETHILENWLFVQLTFHFCNIANISWQCGIYCICPVYKLTWTNCMIIQKEHIWFVSHFKMLKWTTRQFLKNMKIRICETFSRSSYTLYLCYSQYCWQKEK